MKSILLALLLLTTSAQARDLGQWDTATDKDVVEWYRSLKQPDTNVSCCGESDAYWADSFEMSKDGEYVAIITDERPDEPRKRPHVPVGTKVVVPNHKLKFDQGNPTGHGVIFLSTTGHVFCYLPPGGI